MTEEKIQWLEKNDYGEEDIMSDKKGEYVLAEVDNGSPREVGYRVYCEKLYLPK